MIKSLQKTLKDEKEECMGSYFELVDVMICLFEAKLSASKMRVRLLESRCVTKWKEFVEYLQYLQEIIWDINQCAKKVKEVRASMLLIIEAERQRQFSAGIRDSGEILDAATASLARTFKSFEILGRILNNFCPRQVFHSRDAVGMNQLLALPPMNLWRDHGFIRVDVYLSRNETRERGLNVPNKPNNVHLCPQIPESQKSL
ncbi:hypothetical protein K438DRAFT_1773222 [Mycena galopus ATCC 62051]|nr:hypothetical protein K438DRAFT_1773222 [Mycena galopus ATCC 62051]